MRFLIPQIHALTGGTQTSRQMFKDGISAMIEQINSAEFRDAVINYKWKDTNGFWHHNFHQNVYTYTDKFTGTTVTKVLNNKQIYDLIMTGWDKFDQTEDGDIDMESELYLNRYTSTVGYTTKETFKTWMNMKFWIGSINSIMAMIGGNQSHEYMHNLGFSHDYRWNPERDHSVPYAIGTIIHLLINGKFIPGDFHTYKKVCSRTWRTLWILKTCRWVRIDA